MIQQSFNLEADDYYYFFMKAGHGNCFLPMARLMGGLWVGYFEDPIPQLDKQGICQTTSAADLQFMAVATHEKYRNKIRIITFGKDSLLIWEPTGELQYLNASASAVDLSDPNLYSKFPAQWHNEIKQKYGRVGGVEFMDYFYSGSSGAKIIPAKLACDPIPRATLLSSIDSLSVWQSLNRKTFQPMFPLRGNEILKDLEWLTKFESLTPLKITKDKRLEEGSFGKFIRLYLGEYLGRNNSVSNRVTKSELSKTALSILNPAQLETAIMHLCRDLGLTIDVGFGKGLDVADIKATVRHLPTRERGSRVSRALSVLEQSGVNFSSKLKCEIQATSTLRVQCKAYSDVDQRNLGNTLLAVPTLNNNDKQRTDCLNLERASKMGQKIFPELFGWLNLLESDLSRRLQRAL